MEKNKLKIYISYSKNNTNKLLLANVSNILISLGYEVTYWLEDQYYTTSKLDDADVVLFMADTKLNPNVQANEYLSKGQFTELERSNRNNKKILFYNGILGGNLQKQDIVVRTQSIAIKPSVVNSNDWKGRYGTAYSIYSNDYLSTIINSWFISDSLEINNRLLLLIS